MAVSSTEKHESDNLTFQLIPGPLKHRLEDMFQRPGHTMRTLNYCRILATTSLVAAALVTAGFGPAGAADPTGDWRVADGVANIRVAECNGAMWGVVAWEKQPGGVDQNNPDVAKRSRPTLGMPILLDMKKKKPEKEEWDGQVYNAKDGKFYESSIKLASPDQLEIEGCVLGFLCGGETWTRVSGPIPSSPSNNPAGPANPSASSTAKGAPKAGMAKSSPPKAQARTTGQKTTTAATTTATSPTDPVGDICLLPDIAGAAHERGLK
jgi:uncharacterized protein (DUF2147 family)